MRIFSQAAVLLAGWYLMLPPLGGGPEKVNSDAPLRQWQVIEGFDTAEDCRNTAAYDWELLLKQVRPPEVVVKQYTLSTCIATGDPRLKEGTR
jgi:hypothetical protein